MFRKRRMHFARPLMAACFVSSISNCCQAANLAAIQIAHTITQQGFVQNSAPNGVIGMLVDDQTNQIMRIYGESDLNRLGIRVGDYIVSVNGDKTLRGKRLREVLDGPVDWRVWIQFEIAGRSTVPYPVERKDVQLFVQYNDDSLVAPAERGYYQKYLLESMPD